MQISLAIILYTFNINSALLVLTVTILNDIDALMALNWRFISLCPFLMQISLADIETYVILDFVKAVGGEDLLNQNYPDLAKFHKGITDNSKLSEYIKSRPVTKF